MRAWFPLPLGRGLRGGATIFGKFDRLSMGLAHKILSTCRKITVGLAPGIKVRVLLDFY